MGASKLEMANYFSLVEITIIYVEILEVYSSNYGSQMYTRARETRPGSVIFLNQERASLHFFQEASTKMINILELYDLIAYRYLNCYRAYLDILNNGDILELRDTVLHRMHIYYEILEIMAKSINE